MTSPASRLELLNGNNMPNAQATSRTRFFYIAATIFTFCSILVAADHNISNVVRMGVGISLAAVGAASVIAGRIYSGSLLRVNVGAHPQEEEVHELQIVHNGIEQVPGLPSYAQVVSAPSHIPQLVPSDREELPVYLDEDIPPPLYDAAHNPQGSNIVTTPPSYDAVHNPQVNNVVATHIPNTGNWV